MEAWFYFVCVAVVTASTTAMMCHKQWAKRNRVSFSAAANGAVISILVCYLGSLLWDFGADLFTTKFWSDPRGSRNLVFYLFVTTWPSILVALAVMAYHRHRHKHETNAA
jgi:hypothetical protein